MRESKFLAVFLAACLVLSSGGFVSIAEEYAENEQEAQLHTEETSEAGESTPASSSCAEKVGSEVTTVVGSSELPESTESIGEETAKTENDGVAQEIETKTEVTLSDTEVTLEEDVETYLENWGGTMTL